MTAFPLWDRRGLTILSSDPTYVPIDDINDEDSPLTPVSDPDDYTYSSQSEQTLKRAKAVKLRPANLKRRKTGSAIAAYARKNAIETSCAFRLPHLLSCPFQTLPRTSPLSYFREAAGDRLCRNVSCNTEGD